MQIEISELRAMLAQQPSQPPQPQEAPSVDAFWKIGGKYFIRTVTHHYTGILAGVTANEILFTSACWIPDDGRFTQALETGEFKEVELYPKDQLIAVGRGAFLDGCQIQKIPLSQK